MDIKPWATIEGPVREASGQAAGKKKQQGQWEGGCWCWHCLGYPEELGQVTPPGCLDFCIHKWRRGGRQGQRSGPAVSRAFQLHTDSESPNNRGPEPGPATGNCDFEQVLVSLTLSFLICKMGIIPPPPPQGCSRD